MLSEVLVARVAARVGVVVLALGAVVVEAGCALCAVLYVVWCVCLVCVLCVCCVCVVCVFCTVADNRTTDHKSNSTDNNADDRKTNQELDKKNILAKQLIRTHTHLKFPGSARWEWLWRRFHQVHHTPHTARWEWLWRRFHIH